MRTDKALHNSAEYVLRYGNATVEIKSAHPNLLLSEVNIKWAEIRSEFSRKKDPSTDMHNKLFLNASIIILISSKLIYSWIHLISVELGSHYWSWGIVLIILVKVNSEDVRVPSIEVNNAWIGKLSAIKLYLFYFFSIV